MVACQKPTMATATRSISVFVVYGSLVSKRIDAVIDFAKIYKNQRNIFIFN